MRSNELMRDALIDVIFTAAKEDPDIYFISADLGAKALDDFREELPEQFIHAGISEQNMVDLGAGLALSGKKVFLYAMAPFITARCYEQIKCTLSGMDLPVTLIGVGVGLGYDHATITHFTSEDIACMSALNKMQVYSPGDTESAAILAQYCVEQPALRYIRLERPMLSPIYNGSFEKILPDGLGIVKSGKHGLIITSGYLIDSACKARVELEKRGMDVGVLDLFRVKPLNVDYLTQLIADYDWVITLEEQILNGGMGSAVLEAMAEKRVFKTVKRLGLTDGFVVENGGRDDLHAYYGIDIPSVVKTAIELNDCCKN